MSNLRKLGDWHGDFVYCRGIITSINEAKFFGKIEPQNLQTGLRRAVMQVPQGVLLSPIRATHPLQIPERDVSDFYEEPIDISELGRITLLTSMILVNPFKNNERREVGHMWILEDFEVRGGEVGEVVEFGGKIVNYKKEVGIDYGIATCTNFTKMQC